MSRQIFPAYSLGLTGSTTGLGIFTAATAADFVNGLCQAFMPTSGTFKRLRFRLATAPGVGTSWTLALTVNGAASALSVTVSGTATEGILDTDVAVATGDLVRYTITKTGSATNLAFQADLEFEPTTPGEYIYGCEGTAGNNSTGFVALAHGQSCNTSGLDFTIACAGTITKLYVNMADGVFPFSTTPGTGNSIAYVIEKNGVIQDGTGGTVDTSVTCANATNAGNKAFSLPVIAGDLLRIRCVVVGTPNVRPPAVTLVYQASQQLFATSGPGNGLSASPAFMWVAGSRSAGMGSSYFWDATEANRQNLISGPLTAQGITIGIVGSEPWASTDAVTVTLRKNGVDTALTATMTFPNRSATFAGSVDLAAGDLVAFKAVANNGRSPGVFATLVTSSVSTQKTGCFLAGVNTKVKATRAAAFGLDGNTNVHTTPGQLKVFGDLAVTGLVNGGTLSGSNSGDVTVVNTGGYLTRVAQVLTAALINLATMVTGRLPYANLVAPSTSSLLLGRGATTGDWQEISLGTGLSMAGTTLSSTGGGGGGGGSGGGGALVLLEQHTAAGSTSLDFTTRNVAGQSGATFQSDYDEYVIEILNIIPATASIQPLIRVSTNGGSTFDASTIYDYVLNFSFATTTGSARQSTATGFGLRDTSTTLATSTAYNAAYRLFDPLNTSLFKAMQGRAFVFDNSIGPLNLDMCGFYKSTTAVNALRLIMSSGNITSGTMRIYGVAKTPTTGMTQLAQVVTSGSQATVDFSGLSAVFSRIVVEWQAQDTQAGTGAVDLFCKVNGDATAANYTATSRSGVQNAAAVTANVAASTSGVHVGVIPQSGNTGIQAAGTLGITGYAATTFHKRLAGSCATDDGTNGGTVETIGARWKSTAAITELTFSTTGTAFKDGSIFTVYGIP